ncbi:MAG: methyltransferase domain-containing protein [Streptosporangiaceae bacterium]
MTRDTYTHGHHDSVLRSHRRRTAENSAAYLVPHLTGDSVLLDVGCGPGTISVDLARRVGAVVAFDSAGDVLAEGRRLAADEGVANVTFEVADVYAMPYADGSFDIVHAHQVLQHVPDPVRALREMRRVCRPGGIVAARDSDYAGFTWFPELPELAEWMALYQECARANGGEPDAGRRLRSWAGSAGFEEIETTASVWGFTTPEDRQWWGGMWADRILRSAMASQALAEGRAGLADLDRISAGWRTWTAAGDGFFTVPHGEILCRV